MPILTALAVLVVLGERALALFYRLPVDTPQVRAAVERFVRHGDGSTMAALGARLPGTAAGIAFGTVSEARSREAFDVLRPEALTDVRFVTTQRLDAIRMLGRVASLSGFLGAMLEIIWLFNGDRGLLGLQAGLAERVAVGRGLLALCVGMGASVLASATHRTLHQTAQRIVDDTQRLLSAIALQAFPQTDTPAPEPEPKDGAVRDVPT